MYREEILKRATDCVCRDRNEIHGKPENNFGLIAELWSAYLCYPVTAKDVGLMMALLKVARARNAESFNPDNYVDMAGYAACAGERDCIDHKNGMAEP